MSVLEEDSMLCCIYLACFISDLNKR